MTSSQRQPPQKRGFMPMPKRDNTYFEAVLRFIRAAPPAPRLPNVPPIPAHLAEGLKRDPFAETIDPMPDQKEPKNV
jgi:hypothetical protein